MARLTPSSKYIKEPIDNSLTRWGRRGMIVRNVAFVVAVLEGASCGDIALRHGLTKHNVRTIVMRYCFTANKQLFNQGRGAPLDADRWDGLPLISWLREHRDGFVAKFPDWAVAEATELGSA